MVKNKFNLVKGDYWVALYINDNIEFEGHSIEVSDFVKILQEFPGEFEYRELEADWDWLDSLGNFPKHFKDVKIHGKNHSP